MMDVLPRGDLGDWHRTSPPGRRVYPGHDGLTRGLGAEALAILRSGRETVGGEGTLVPSHGRARSHSLDGAGFLGLGIHAEKNNAIVSM